MVAAATAHATGVLATAGARLPARRAVAADALEPFAETAARAAEIASLRSAADAGAAPALRRRRAGLAGRHAPIAGAATAAAAHAVGTASQPRLSAGGGILGGIGGGAVERTVSWGASAARPPGSGAATVTAGPGRAAAGVAAIAIGHGCGALLARRQAPAGATRVTDLRAWAE